MLGTQYRLCIIRQGPWDASELLNDCLRFLHTIDLDKLYAASEVPDEIDMENEAYEEHKRDIVVFSHKSHSETYTEVQPELFNSGCGECHHDENNKPLKLKPGDDVKGCIACHSKPGRMPIKERRALR